MRRVGDTVDRGQFRDPPCLGNAAGARDIGLHQSKDAVAQRGFERRGGKLLLARREPDRQMRPQAGITGKILGRDRLLVEKIVEVAEDAAEFQRVVNIVGAVHVDPEFDPVADEVSHLPRPGNGALHRCAHLHLDL